MCSFVSIFFFKQKTVYEMRIRDWSSDVCSSDLRRPADQECLTIIDDATHEAVAIEVECAISGQALTRVLDRLALSRDLPRTIRTDNGKEFCGKAMLEWAHARGVALRLIEPGKPNQNAYVVSFNGRFRDRKSTRLNSRH